MATFSNNSHDSLELTNGAMTNESKDSSGKFDPPSKKAPSPSSIDSRPRIASINEEEEEEEEDEDEEVEESTSNLPKSTLARPTSFTRGTRGKRKNKRKSVLSILEIEETVAKPIERTSSEIKFENDQSNENQPELLHVVSSNPMNMKRMINGTEAAKNASSLLPIKAPPPPSNLPPITVHQRNSPMQSLPGDEGDHCNDDTNVVADITPPVPRTIPPPRTRSRKCCVVLTNDPLSFKAFVTETSSWKVCDD